MKKTICIFLSLLFVICCLSACAENNGPAEESKDEGQTTDVVTDEPTKADIADEFLAKIPDANYKRTFNVLVMSGVGNSEKEIYAEDASSEPIENAVFLRNAAMLDKLGVTITMTPQASVATAAQNDIKANAKSYDLIMANGIDTGSLAQNGYLYNFLDLAEHMNLDQEWWDPGTLRDCAINGKVFFMNGDINILDNDVTWIMLFNKKMIADNDLEEPYQLVRDKKWTLDKFFEMVRTVSKDSNGDGKYDENDTYGFITTNGGGLTNFMYTSDIRTVTVEDGTPKIVMGEYQEKIVSVLEFCKKLIHDGNFTWISQNPVQSKEMFMNNQGLFYSEVLSYIVNLSDMDSPYGVLPTPLYDENQKEYRTHVDNVGSIISIPSNIDDPAQTATIIEAFALYSYKFVTPAYYDVTLKRKKSRDSESSEMIDIILQSRTYDIGYIYNSIGLAEVFRGLAQQGSADFASKYKQREKAAEKALKSIMKKYDKL